MQPGFADPGRVNLAHQLRLFPQVAGFVYNDGAGLLVLGVAESGGKTGAAFDQNLMPQPAEPHHLSRGARHAPLIFVGFFGDADFHWGLVV